jgi:Raf kinase inhibitor-like YbhB/YbcL family protein
MSVTTQLRLTSTAFTEGGAIPAMYTCDGENISPPLSWEPGPAGTAAWVLIAEDIDARLWVHWLVVNLPADTTSLPDGVSGNLPPGAVEGETDFGSATYGGPCPPSGEDHRYTFTLYALSEPLVQGAELAAAPVRAQMFGKVLGEGTLTGRFTRTSASKGGQ